MLEHLLTTFVPVVVRAIELIGVTIIALGAVATLAQFARVTASRGDIEQAVARLRTNLGRAILIGLEFLVAADIIHTVLVQMTLESVAALAGIVIIRILLSFSLETEIEGRLPWRRGTRHPRDRRE